MNKLLLLTCVLTIGLFINSCEDDGDIGDILAPQVTILTPADGAVFNAGDTMQVTGAVADDTELQFIIIETDLGFRDSLSTFDSPTAHALEYNLILDPATQAGDYPLTISANDASDNEGSATITVTIQ